MLAGNNFYHLIDDFFFGQLGKLLCENLLENYFPCLLLYFTRFDIQISISAWEGSKKYNTANKRLCMALGTVQYIAEELCHVMYVPEHD